MRCRLHQLRPSTERQYKAVAQNLTTDGGEMHTIRLRGDANRHWNVQKKGNKVMLDEC